MTKSREELERMSRGPAAGGPVPAAGDVPIQINVRLPLRTLEQLDALAGSHEEGRSQLISEALSLYLAHLKETA